MTSLGRILLIPVAYENESDTQAFLHAINDQTCANSIHVCVADNSRTASSTLANYADSDLSTHYFHFPTNPGYLGGPRLALSTLVGAHGPLDYDAVVVCNIDLTFNVRALLQAVDAAKLHVGSTRWILAPDIREGDGSVRMNPHLVRRPSPMKRVLMSSLDLSYVTAVAYRGFFSIVRRWRATQSGADDAPPAFSRLFAPHGSFMIFGAEYFTSGGSFQEAPLFNEEVGIGEIAALLDIPILFTPQLRVDHAGRATTGSLYSRRRYQMTSRALKFYRYWSASNSIGGMSSWFKNPQS